MTYTDKILDIKENYMSYIDNIRNFCIIAHIDHGKSTLADRILEKTGVLTQREMENQVLDNMDLEKERGITIKAQSVRLNYKAKNGNEYVFNLIDTPGHVDFNYEVSRTLAACEGAVLVVDAAQGVEAQTLANVYLAIDNNLDVIPVINKIDLPAAQPDVVKKEIEDIIGLPAEDAPLISAKAGIGIEDVLEAIVEQIPSPKGSTESPLKGLIFDSYYDAYKGVIIYVRIYDGKVKKGDTIRLMASNKEYVVTETGWFKPGALQQADVLQAGEVGYIAAAIKNISDATVGDTVTLANNPTKDVLPGYKKVQPMVFCGVYPVDGADYEDLRDRFFDYKNSFIKAQYDDNVYYSYNMNDYKFIVLGSESDAGVQEDISDEQFEWLEKILDRNLWWQLLWTALFEIVA